MRQSTNVVNVQGILNEIGIEERTDSSGRKYISGRVTLLVDQAIYDGVERNEVQVSAFSYELTKAGKLNPSYASLKKLMDEGVSVAATGNEETADKYRIGGADLRTNEFDSKDGRHIVYPEVRASFFSKVTGGYEPTATFEQEIYILDMHPEEKNDEETGRYIVKGAVVGYNDRVDIIDYVIENPQAIEYIRNNWGECVTVHVTGKIRAAVTKITRTDSAEIGFGEPITRTYDRVVREYVITAGSPPIEDGFEPEDMANAIAKKNNAVKSAPAPTQKPINRGF